MNTKGDDLFSSKKLKIFTIPSLFHPSSELVLLFSLLKEIPKEGIHCYNFKGESRYSGVIEWCNKNTEITTNISECSCIVLPYKFKNTDDPIFLKLDTLSKRFAKPLLCFYNDDNDSIFEISSNVHLFRTSFYNHTKLDTEISLPAFSPDYFNGVFLDSPGCSIGYCGHCLHGRFEYLNELQHSMDISYDFILRDGFWAKGIDKITARREYFTNMENNLFTFCYRGAGNFSYRFYETLMMGRIPVLVDTDCVFLHRELLTEDVGLILNENEISSDKVGKKIREYYELNLHRLGEIQRKNRILWEKYYSIIGFLNFIQETYI